MAVTVDQAFDFVRLDALGDAEERCRRALDAMERIKAAVAELNELAGTAPLDPPLERTQLQPVDPDTVTGRLADLLGAQTPPAEPPAVGANEQPAAVALDLDDDDAVAEAAQVLSEATAAMGTQLRQDVWLVVFQAAGEGISPKEVCGALPHYPYTAVRRTLTQLHDTGELQRTGATKSLRYTATPSSPRLQARSTFQDLVLDTVRHHQGQYDRDELIANLRAGGAEVTTQTGDAIITMLIRAGQISERSDGILQYGPAGS